MAEPSIRFKRDDGSCYPEWKEVRLGDVASRVTRKNMNNETDRPLTIASIEGLVDQRTYFGKTVASKDMSGYFLLKNGEYAYNKSYSVGYDYGSIKRLDKYDMGALSTLYICFALNDGENSDFFNCYFNGLSWYNQMAEICAEGARNHGLLNVSANDFFNIKISVPSNPEEQQKIADFLSSVDEVIAASEAEVQNLETQKKAVMKKIFSQEVRFKREDGTDFPEWKHGIVNDYLADITYGFTNPMPDSEFGPWKLTAKDIVDGRICFDTARHTSEAAFFNDLTDKSRPKVNDILLTKDGTLGRVALVRNDELICINQSVALLRLKDDEKISPLFFMLMLMSPLYQEKMLADAGGGTIKHIYITKVDKMEFDFPCSEEQSLIADFLSDFDETIAAAKKELELWKELKKGLLQQMFV